MKNPAKSGGESRRGSRAAWFEVGAVIVLICAPTLSWVACSLAWGSDFQNLGKQQRRTEYQRAVAFDSGMVESMFIRLRLVPIFLFLMWRSGETWSRFGLVKPRLARDLLFGLILLLAVESLDLLIALTFKRPHPAPYPVGVPFIRGLLVLGNCCATGFAEELELRAYLIPRVEGLTGATWKAVLLSIVIFGFVHLHKSYIGVISSVAAASVYSIAFCATRRIWPVAIAHALHDFVIETQLAVMIGP